MALHRRSVLKLGGALVVALSLALSASLLPAQSGKVDVLWLGQATFKITTPGGKVIVIDPFVTGNPKTPAEYKDLAKLGKVDVILVTHGHSDHVGTAGRNDGGSDLVDLAKRSGAKVFGPAGLIQTLIDLGWLTAEQAVRFGKSGKVIVIDPFVTRNPKTPADYKDLAKLGKVDLILVTHGHGDHVGKAGRNDGGSDLVDLAKRSGAKVFGPAGLVQTLIDLGWRGEASSGVSRVNRGCRSAIELPYPQVQVRSEANPAQIRNDQCRRAPIEPGAGNQPPGDAGPQQSDDR